MIPQIENKIKKIVEKWKTVVRRASSLHLTAAAHLMANCLLHFPAVFRFFVLFSHFFCFCFILAFSVCSFVKRKTSFIIV